MTEAETTRLPRGRHRVPAEVVEHSQRSRLLGAMTDEVAEVGYGAARIADVARRAGVSLSSFYTHFDGKPECFLAAYGAVADALIDELDQLRDVEDPGDRLLMALTAYLTWFAQRPSAAAAYLVEVHAAGPAGLGARSAVIERIAQTTIALADGAAPEHALRAYLLLVDAIAHEEVVAGRATKLPDIAPRLLELGVRLLG